MENLVWLIPALACPLMMVGMMWMMGKGMGRMNRGGNDEQHSLGELRGERERLEAEIERRERAGEPSGAASRATHV